MLGLLTPTDPSWVEAVDGDLDRLLSDHAHCELKAAHSALSLVGRHGGAHPNMVDPLVALAREETDHFHEVQQRIAARGGRLGPPASDDYVTSLRREARRDGSDTPALLDRLLVSALIEARSCERFKLLSERLASSSLRAFYGDLMASEAGHFRLFCRLAEACFGVEATRSRLGELARREARVSHQLPLGPTVHG
jgi:tRNA 2-(methylsulfanyl)-N6-isopentenyladenosine37 hydroxylase